MTDREFLELAAKAYWGDEIDDVVSVEWSDQDNAILYTHGENQDHNGLDVTLVWNPITDDGDALRLAVKLKMDVECLRDATQVNFMDRKHNTRHFNVGKDEGCNSDIYAATRRAIVRAAAEIGKAA